jgi:hypothetical protein
MKITYLNERPSAFTAACAHAHADRVGRMAVPSAPVSRWQLAAQPIAFNNLFKQQESVQLQDAQANLQAANGRTAKTIGMARSPITGVKASGVPPRGSPV